MASRRVRPIHPRGDVSTYRVLLDDMLAGRVRPTAIDDVTAPAGVQSIAMRSENAEGVLETVIVQHPKTRLVSLAIDDAANGAQPATARRS